MLATGRLGIAGVLPLMLVGVTPSVRADEPVAAREKLYFTGVTEQQAFGRFTLSVASTWQAGEYIKFTVESGDGHRDVLRRDEIRS